MIDLSNIKDPAVRMRLAIAQKEPHCEDCKHWIPRIWTPWCKKHETTDGILRNSTLQTYCPDFHD